MFEMILTLSYYTERLFLEGAGVEILEITGVERNSMVSVSDTIALFLENEKEEEKQIILIFRSLILIRRIRKKEIMSNS